MILSALLTSVWINVALCFLFLILYTILRNRPSNAELYVPRLVAEGKFPEVNEFGLRWFLSSFKWVKRAWEPTEAELLENSGLDAVVLFMRILIFGILKGSLCCDFDDELEVPSNPHHKGILFITLLGITYFFLAPLILPFVLIYYGLRYIIYRNQLLNVYAPKFETGGKFWPVVHDATIVFLILMHIIAIGIFGLKKLPLASSLTIPLPFSLSYSIAIAGDDSYLPSKVFLLRLDHNDPSISSFYEKLATAYQDPAMELVRYSAASESSTTPLLRGYS